MSHRWAPIEQRVIGQSSRQLLILLFLLDFGGVLNLNSISDRYLVFQWYGFIVTQTGKEELNHEQASDPLLVRHFNLFIELKLVF